MQFDVRDLPSELFLFEAGWQARVLALLFIGDITLPCGRCIYALLLGLILLRMRTFFRASAAICTESLAVQRYSNGLLLTAQRHGCVPL